MKTVLLILVALMLSAQPARDPAFIPGEYLTAGALNGHWWTHATHWNVESICWPIGMGRK